MLSDNYGSKAKVTVFVVGPSLKVRGGISTLIGTVMRKCPRDIRYRMIATHSNCRGSDESRAELPRLAVQAVFYFAALIKLVTALAFFRDKVFHVHVSQEGSTLRKGFICIFLRICRCRYLIHMHAAEGRLFHSWVPGFVRRAITWGLSGCRYCLVLNQFWADYYVPVLSIAAEKLLVMPNPADIPPQLPNRSGRDKLKILFLGRIGARKGVYDLVRAFAILPQEIKRNCELTLAGDGETQKVFRLAAASGCTAHVTVTGWLERGDVGDLLRDSDVFVLPSYAEGMAISVLEAMAWGLAVITTDAGGSESFLDDRRNCLLVKPGDISGICDAIRNVYENPELRLSLGQQARTTAEGLSIDRYVHALSIIYQKTAKSTVPPPDSLRDRKPTLTHSFTK